MRLLHRIPLVLLLLLCAAAAPAADYLVGNLNPPEPPSAPGILTGDQVFAYLIHPVDQVPPGVNGFQLEAVTMLLDFTPQQLPAFFTVQGGLRKAVYEPSQDAWLPGDPVCQGQTFPYQITEPGLQEIRLPVDPACGCLHTDDYFFLTVTFWDPVVGNLVTDGQPEAGVVYLNDGTGWVDMVNIVPAPDKTAGGKVIIWGDILTCEPPVGAEKSAWGHIKSVYR